MIDLEKKVAIITGGSKGIGKAIAFLFHELGAEIHILDIDEVSGGKTLSEISSSRGGVTFHPCDVSDHQAVGEVFKSVYDRSGRLDILVNNAGISHIGTVESTSPEDMDKLYAVNVKSVYSCSHFAVMYMKKTGGGSIVNVSSIAADTGLADRFAYTMSKGAVRSMTYSVAKDYIQDNIRCNAVGPARIHTPFVDGYLDKYYPDAKEEMFDKLSKTQPLGRMGEPREVAQLIAYLCSDAAGFITGSFYPIDGGFLHLNTD